MQDYKRPTMRNTFGKGTATPWSHMEGVEENREALLDLCREYNLTPSNTRFAKPPKKLATWRTMNTVKGDPMDRQHFDQIDYILIPKIWQNGVQDAESDMEANAPVGKVHLQIKNIAHQSQLKKVKD